MAMRVGTVKVAEDLDFRQFKEVCDGSDGWNLEVNKQKTMVWTKVNDQSSFHMVKIRTVFEDVPASVMYDVLHDPMYRKTWDRSMLEGNEICVINPNNDIGYYAIKCPAPLKNRDFVTQRSWLDTGNEYIIFNHSVNHADGVLVHWRSIRTTPHQSGPSQEGDSRSMPQSPRVIPIRWRGPEVRASMYAIHLHRQKQPVRKGVIRGISYLTGYLIRYIDEKSCQLTYVSQSDPKGNLPAWAMNKLTRILAPKVINRIYKAAKNYTAWKSKNRPEFKPWLYPEQLMASLPHLNPDDIQEFKLSASSESLEESSELHEEDFKDDDL